MKLKRTKLAALAITALVAAGAMSSLAFASETDQAAATSADDGAYKIDTDTIKFDYAVENYVVTNDSMNVTYTAQYIVDGVTEWEKELTATAEIAKVTEADCTNDGYTILVVTLVDDSTWNSVEYATEKALGHDMQEVKSYVTVDPGHETYGTKVVYKECSRCGEPEEIEESIDPTGHTWSSTYTYVPSSKVENPNILVDENGDAILKDGEPQLADPAQDGYYDIIVYCTDYDPDDPDEEHGYIVIATKQLFLAENYYYAAITDTYKIAETSLVGYGKAELLALNGTDGYVDYSNVSTLKLSTIGNDNVELTDCEATDAYYIITYYNEDMKPINYEKVSVSAHHMKSVAVEFKTALDKAECEVEYTSATEYTIYSKSCYMDVEYYEVTHCSAACCLKNSACTTADSLVELNDKYLDSDGNVVAHASLAAINKETKTAEHKGEHTYQTSVINKIKETAEGGATFETLEAMATDYVTVTGDTSSCTEDGTATLTYYCMVCGEKLGAETVSVKAKGHDWQLPVKEQVKEQTCEDTGYYHAVTYCSRCNEIKEDRLVTIPRDAHTNELEVSNVGIGNDDDFDTDSEGSTYSIGWTGSVVVDPGDGLYLTVYQSGKAVKDDGGNTVVSADGVITDGCVLTGYDDEDNKDYDYGKHAGSTEYPTMLGVYAYAQSICGTCGNYTVTILDGGEKATGSVTIEIVSVTKENSSTGSAGSIKLKATYTKDGKTIATDTKTYPYFSSLAAYQRGTIDDPYTGLKIDDDGVCRYYVEDVFTAVNGIYEYNGGEFFVANGVVCSDATGLNLYDGEWYYLVEGKVQTQFTGFAEYDGEWFYLKRGKLDDSVSGLVEYDGSYFLLCYGRLMDEVSGLWQYSSSISGGDDEFYLLLEGRWVENSGVVFYDGAAFLVENGKLSSYTGTYVYDGATFNVVNGQFYDQVA